VVVGVAVVTAAIVSTVVDVVAVVAAIVAGVGTALDRFGIYSDAHHARK
jgi:hypothetical protein